MSLHLSASYSRKRNGVFLLMRPNFSTFAPRKQRGIYSATDPSQNHATEAQSSGSYKWRDAILEEPQDLVINKELDYYEFKHRCTGQASARYPQCG